MGLFGSKPTKRAASSYELELGRNADSMGQAASRYGIGVNLQDRGLLAGKIGERSDILGTASADAAQRFGAPVIGRNQALDNAVNRGKGLSRLLSATSNQFDSQLLRDRIASVGYGRARQGRGLSALTAAAGIQGQLDEAGRVRSQGEQGIRQNTLGTAAGIGAGIIANRGNLFPNRGLPQGRPAGNSYSPAYDPMTGQGAMNA